MGARICLLVQRATFTQRDSLNLLRANNIDLKLIAQYTGLSEQEIAQLQDELKPH